MPIITHDNIDELIETSVARIKEIETEFWSSEPNEEILNKYHAAFQQMEQLIASKGEDKRHEFIIVIPVADSPQHLQNCLDSLLNLCKKFYYGGFSDNRFQKVSAIIADDSQDPDNISKHKAIADEFNKLGLMTLYFGLDEQLDQIESLAENDKKVLSRIIGNINEDAFYHKGSSTMRNIIYLELNKIKSENILFYFVDSDQEFQLKFSTESGDKNFYACNYLFHLDQIFSSTETLILTGKVVGDPPVSPSVMTGNFLEDVIFFLHKISEYHPSHPCRFHRLHQNHNDGASYHDMAALFGFKHATESYLYNCSIMGEHVNAQCFSDFSNQLNKFFYGEHPTRKTYYRHEQLLDSIQPARTVYAGNYIIKPEGLNYFIPFAPLKLRMPGPVMGRLLKTEINSKFVSANLPMLHKRTVHETGKSEFRPGVAVNPTNIDLSREFERQFYGDVMLFTIEQLCALGYPKKSFDKKMIADLLEATHGKMLQKYNENRKIITSRLSLLKTLLNDQQHWWNKSPEHADPVQNFNAFIKNIEHNFGDNAPGYKLIDSSDNKMKHLAEMLNTIANLTTDKIAWNKTLSSYV